MYGSINICGMKSRKNNATVKILYPAVNNVGKPARISRIVASIEGRIPKPINNRLKNQTILLMIQRPNVAISKFTLVNPPKIPVTNNVAIGAVNNPKIGIKRLPTNVIPPSKICHDVITNSNTK